MAAAGDLPPVGPVLAFMHRTAMASWKPRVSRSPMSPTISPIRLLWSGSTCASPRLRTCFVQLAGGGGALRGEPQGQADADTHVPATEVAGHAAPCRTAHARGGQFPAAQGPAGHRR